jgi:hypothetical protein
VLLGVTRETKIRRGKIREFPNRIPTKVKYSTSTLSLDRRTPNTTTSPTTRNTSFPPCTFPSNYLSRFWSSPQSKEPQLCIPRGLLRKRKPRRKMQTRYSAATSNAPAVVTSVYSQAVRQTRDNGLRLLARIVGRIRLMDGSVGIRDIEKIFY